MTGDDTGGAPASSAGADGDAPPGRHLDRTLFRAMVREEWRMHADLFGPRRFAAFPLFVALLTAAGVQFLSVADVELATVVAGVHGLVFLFGLQTGTVGFVGRDAMRNLLGDVTLLVFTTRTLPVGRRRTLGIFLLKDLAYYAVLFMVPLAVAFVPAALDGGLAPVQVALLWATLTATFAYGIAVTLVLVALSTRGVSGRAAILGLAASGGLAWSRGVDPLAATPYALFASPSATAAAGLLPIPALAALGVWLHDPEYERPNRSVEDRFARWHERLAGIGDDRGLVTRSLLDVHRSSGGVVKVAFSAGILFLVSAFLVELVAPIVGTDPSTGVTFGALLGLSAFTSFNWLTRFDDPGEYLHLPLGLSAVFAAKLRAFLVLSVPVGLAFLAVAAAWLGARPAELLVGAVLLVGLQVYLFGLVVYLAGFSPNEFLFDTVLFAGFGAAVAVPL
ncbi:MAG: hypothetical protein V5A37_07980, partial [Halobacteriales archaeon]